MFDFTYFTKQNSVLSLEISFNDFTLLTMAVYDQICPLGCIHQLIYNLPDVLGIFN